MIKKLTNVLLIIISTLIISTPCYADTTKPESQPNLEDFRKMTLTCYLPTGNKTASGIVPHYGIAAAKREWIGKTALVYERTEDNEMGEFIGKFDIQDTGGSRGIKNGNVIDIFCETREDCLPTQKVYVYLQDPEQSYEEKQINKKQPSQSYEYEEKQINKKRPSRSYKRLINKKNDNS